MTVATKEAVAEEAFRDWCRELGLWCLKCSLPGFNGLPDRLVIGPQRLIVFLEFKKLGETARTQQEDRHATLRYWGFAVHTCYTKEQGIAAVQTEIQRSHHH